MASIKKISTSTGQVRYRVRWRNPARKQEERRFRRKVDARAFASTLEADKVRGEWVDPRGRTQLLRDLAPDG